MKAEQYIKEHTNDDSNMIGGYNDNGEPQVLYTPWITKDDALYAIKLAKEETTEKIKRLLKENYLIKSAEPLRWVSWEKVFNYLKQAMKR